jgi:hypothetical protein
MQIPCVLALNENKNWELTSFYPEFNPVFTISKLNQEKIAIFFNFGRVSLHCPAQTKSFCIAFPTILDVFSGCINSSVGLSRKRRLFSLSSYQGAAFLGRATS